MQLTGIYYVASLKIGLLYGYLLEIGLFELSHSFEKGSLDLFCCCEEEKNEKTCFFLLTIVFAGGNPSPLRAGLGVKLVTIPYRVWGRGREWVQ